MATIDMGTFIPAVVLVVVFVGTLIGLMLTMEYIRNNRFKREKEKANTDIRIKTYENLRQEFESKIYKLQKDLSENVKRWEDANHLLIDGQDAQSNDTNVNVELNGLPLFKNLNIEKDVDKQKVFVLTPFIDNEQMTFRVIKNVCEGVNLKCFRGDETYRANDILTHILGEIITARVVIANINGRNPNVLYELGICHAIGKQVIIVSRNTNKFPFDIAGKNILIYKNIDDLYSLLKNELLKLFISE